MHYQLLLRDSRTVSICDVRRIDKVIGRHA
jgi:hypothetical protein